MAPALPSPAPGPRLAYTPRRPETGTLYKVAQENLKTLYAAAGRLVAILDTALVARFRSGMKQIAIYGPR